MPSIEPSSFMFGRLIWRCLPVVLLPILLLLLTKPLVRHKTTRMLQPDYTVWLHRTEIVFDPNHLYSSPVPKPPVTRLMRVTAYCPCKLCCGSHAAGITASGHAIAPHDAFAAADPQLPFGTTVIVPGYNEGKPVQILDRGGAIKGDRLDVFFSDHRKALEWGIRDLSITFESAEPNSPL
jgi:3D (Asp-Asp-Asp) domain-containing protein